MTARYLVADVFDGLAQLEPASVDFVMTSPPFLALRSYLPADHADKGREIGSEATPAAFVDTMTEVVAALGRVLAPHGSIVFELGDTYAGSGGAGGDYGESGWRDGQLMFRQMRGGGWPLAKSKCLLPEAFAIALAYGHNPISGEPTNAGRWRVRNVVAWCRPNPPVGALGDKFRPAHSSMIVATRSATRYWDDLPTRRAWEGEPPKAGGGMVQGVPRQAATAPVNASGAPLLDWWNVTARGYKGAHYATYPEAVCAPMVVAMTPERVCTTCGEPARRVVERSPEYAAARARVGDMSTKANRDAGAVRGNRSTNAAEVGYEFTTHADVHHAGWTDCGHNTWRRGVVLDPFAGTGTTLAVAVGYGRDAVGIDLDERNRDHARQRLGLFMVDG